MRALFLLSGENIPLASMEIRQLLAPENFFTTGNLALGKIPRGRAGLWRRLAFTKSAYELLFFCSRENILRAVRDYCWNDICHGSFCVRAACASGGSPESGERELAKEIWQKVKNPNVDLQNPSLLIQFFFLGKRVYCGRLLWKNEERFSERNPSARPAPHPTSLQPKLARALVNLSGCISGTLTDPFCGSGGILIEAGLMGIPVHGSDLYQEMAQRAIKNLAHYRIKDFTVKQLDANTLRPPLGYIACDVPYGQNASLWALQDGKPCKAIRGTGKNNIPALQGFYRSFLRNLKKHLAHQAAVIFPHYAQGEALVTEAGFAVVGMCTQFIHSTLTREIVVFRQQKNGASGLRTKKAGSLRHTAGYSSPRTKGNRS
ncbi:hypothetical protein HYU14_03880 [Candidatus Woesearchaeota archaeon]|nr:hypothetical protein [Candidatus Woesearchaeota archaeon]